MESSIIENTINNVKYSFNGYGIDHDSFMTELEKYEGVIAGSFMYMNFVCSRNGKNPTDLEKINDIDIYICDKTDRSKNSIDEYYHNFEKYIMQNITNEVKTTESYIFTDGIILSRTYVSEKINLNVILLNEPAVQFINNNFDLDCCKIIYDGKTCQVYNLNDLLKDTTECRYNKCTLEHMYKDNNIYWTKAPSKIGYGSKYSIYFTDAFAKFKKFFKIYSDKKNGIVDPNDKYTLYLKIISRQVILDDIFENITMENIDQIIMTDKIVKIISMIRTHERIDKYKNRGIKLVKLHTEWTYF